MDFDDLASAAMRAHDFPGMAVGALVDGSEWYASYGIRSVEDPMPVNH
jgi:hypothetical protein